jgi:hypothetical protein
VRALAPPAGYQDFRLTLTSGLPVTTADVTAAGTIYCTPTTGNRISLYDGIKWNVRTSAEFSKALSALTSGKPYDVFCYDNANVPTLEFLVWTNDTTRATALTTQDGILVKSGDALRRYLGTFYTTGVATTEDSLTSRYLWNYYNRVRRSMVRKEATASYTYTTATWRQANAAAANKLQYVVGVAEDPVTASIRTCAANGSGSGVAVAVGVDSITVPSGLYIGSSAVVAIPAHVVADYEGIPGVGAHYLAWLEIAQATGTTTWYTATTINTIPVQAGIQGAVFS